MSWINRLLLLIFSLMALVVGVLFFAIYFGFMVFDVLNRYLGPVGWVAFWVIWVIIAVRMLIASFSGTEKSKPKVVTQATLVAKSSHGEMVLTPEVVHAMAMKALEPIAGISEVQIRPYFKKDKMDLAIRLNAEAGKILPELIQQIQTKISEELFQQTGIRPSQITVQVDQILAKENPTIENK